MELVQLVTLFGIPTAITGFAIWWVKHKIEVNEKKHEQREKNLESLVLMMMESTRANTNLCVAIGEAVRDGSCNGNMTNALAKVNEVQEREKKFLLDLGVKHIFE